MEQVLSFYKRVLHKSIGTILFCLLILFKISGCGDDGAMGYVVEIIDKGSGQCTYYFTYKKGSNTRDFEMNTACGRYKVGEGIIIPKN